MVIVFGRTEHTPDGAARITTRTYPVDHIHHVIRLAFGTMSGAFASWEIVARDRVSALYTPTGCDVHHTWKLAVCTNIGRLNTREIIDWPINATRGALD